MPTSTPTKKVTKVKQVEIEIYRKSGETFFKFSIDPKLEKIFKKQSNNKKRTSTSWKGLQFYHYPSVISDKAYKDLLRSYNLFDDYGHQFVRDNNSLNIAFLRTVGGKGEVKLPQELPFAVVATGLKDMQQFLKKFYSEFLADYKVTATVQLEV